MGLHAHLQRTRCTGVGQDYRYTRKCRSSLKKEEVNLETEGVPFRLGGPRPQMPGRIPEGDTGEGYRRGIPEEIPEWEGRYLRGIPEGDTGGECRRGIPEGDTGRIPGIPEGNTGRRYGGYRRGIPEGIPEGDTGGDTGGETGGETGGGDPTPPTAHLASSAGFRRRDPCPRSSGPLRESVPARRPACELEGGVR